MARLDPQQSYLLQPHPPRWKFQLILGLIVVGAALAGAAWVELQESFIQASHFAERAKTSTWTIEPGADKDIWLPGTGPYEQRLGYAQLNTFLPRLASAGFTVAAQARQSEGFRSIVERGHFPIYREKSRAGLTILDRNDQSLYDSQYPRVQYADFEAIPPVLVEALLFIENRDLLDANSPKHNPAVDWGRLTRVAAGQAARQVGLGGGRAGGSTLATQIEKFRHSPGGRTHDSKDKYHQMISAALRAYQDGEENLPARRRIVLDFVNSVPLGGIPGYGEVNGLGDGLWAWYGQDFGQINQLLADPKADLTQRAKAFKQALSLFVAQRRPSGLLGDTTGRLNTLTDSYIRLLADDQLIPADLREAALLVQISPARQARPAEEVSFVERKAVNEIRGTLGDLLNVENLYALDRYDLTVHSTLDGPSQQAVTRILNRLADPAFLACAGLKETRLLARGDPKQVNYSLTLYERTPTANVLRIQADNLDQPLDINAGTKLDLGSSAKFRTLVSYLLVVADLHKRYSQTPPEELAKLKQHPADRLSNWAIDILRTKPETTLEALLEAAMERRYSASPGETFFTGGGIHRFGNFKHEDDGKVPSVAEALEQSVNLSFVRIMHDVVHYHAYEAADAPARGLRDKDDDDTRQAFLNRFAEREGLGFLRTYWHKYRDVAPADRLEVLSDSVPSRPVPQAAAYLSVLPKSDFESFAAFMRKQLGDRAGTDGGLRRLFDAHATRQYNLADQGYLARVHPLELWLVRHLQSDPKATLKDIVPASVEARRDASKWLFAPRFKHAQQVRIDIVVEVAAFERIAEEWRRLGYPFEHLVPSLATAIGSSADRPAALAELMGIVVNDGIRRPTVRIDELRFATNTPFETRLQHQNEAGQRVMPIEVAQVTRRALLRVVNSGTARRIKDTYRDNEEKPLAMGGKTGTGDHRSKVIGADGGVRSAKVMNRAATFAFYIGERFYGVVTAFVPGSKAAGYDFTSALPVQIMKEMEPALRPLIADRPAAEGKCKG
ncbi:transglycosylase domain-containing protein [Ferribacterium limneticum]|uniref:transglycosylase domain-containing protein n=1 Tax=Ferribacterium limneticum TaxID=76259 RepID=UPI001CF81A09|nr:transglycosylase domain-containing protein [Ferribacterium limneticum]UCV21626.1 transglycosylase domain-containing protein [Ferribacterium limneticum]